MKRTFYIRNLIILMKVILAFVCIQFFAFIGLIFTGSHFHPIPHPDLVVVFGGWPVRYTYGLALAKQLNAKAFVASDMELNTVQKLAKEAGLPKSVRIIPEPCARTTLQNAFRVAKIIRQEQARQVVLVTSWQHVPRAWLLLQMRLFGQGVTVRPAACDAVPPMFWMRRFFWHEMAGFWGSLIKGNAQGGALGC